MQLKASKTQKYTYKRTVADDVCRSFLAQHQTVTDPNMVQPGQVVVDQMGNEMQVVENEPTDPNVVLAPAGEEVPEGTTTVPNQELNQYTIDTQTQEVVQ